MILSKDHNRSDIRSFQLEIIIAIFVPSMTVQHMTIDQGTTAVNLLASFFPELAIRLPAAFRTGEEDGERVPGVRLINKTFIGAGIDEGILLCTAGRLGNSRSAGLE